MYAVNNIIKYGSSTWFIFRTNSILITLERKFILRRIVKRRSLRLNIFSLSLCLSFSLILRIKLDTLLTINTGPEDNGRFSKNYKRATEFARRVRESSGKDGGRVTCRIFVTTISRPRNGVVFRPKFLLIATVGKQFRNETYNNLARNCRQQIAGRIVEGASPPAIDPRGSSTVRSPFNVAANTFFDVPDARSGSKSGLSGARRQRTRVYDIGDGRGEGAPTPCMETPSRCDEDV